MTKVDGIATATRYCAFAAPLVLGLLLVSPAGAAAFSSGADPVELDLVDPPSVVTVVFDELHLPSLLDADGRINADRYPNFARLASRSTWYRNASSPLARTPEAVPALLSGTLPDGGSEAPVAADFDRTLLTLLGNTHEVRAYEPATDLCEAPCAPLVPQPSFDIDRLGSLLRDAGVVYRHQVLPQPLSENLPDVSARLAGFGHDEVAADLVKFYELGEESSPTTQAIRFDQLVESIGPDHGPEAIVHHTLLPHRPWRLLEDGRYHAPVEDDPAAVVPGDEAAVRHANQRYAQQLGWTDVLLGQLLDRFDQEERWDDTILVVTADHGVNLAVDQAYREPGAETDSDLYRVPLFVSRPGDGGGVVDDCPATTLDIMPTVVEAVGADPGWSFDGTPLDDCSSRGERVATVRVEESDETVVPATVDDLLERAAELESWYGGTDWAGLYAVGTHREEVGRAVDELGVDEHPRTWTLDQRGQLGSVGDTTEGVVPSTLTGRIDGAQPGEALAVVDGTVAGIVVIRSDGSFRGLVDPAALPSGSREVTLLMPDGEGGWIDPGPPAD